jgi:NAD(P)-dependent dehydrogenase (short-subunit alcohol dehydrogenase family)
MTDAVQTALEGKRVAEATVYIADGTNGVGLQVARHFVRAGTQRIGLVGHDAERGESAAEHIRSLASGVWALFAAGDVNDPLAADRVTRELTASLGPADILINCTSSAFTPQPFHETPPGQIQEVLLQQALAPVNMCRAVIGDMRAQGSGVIVNVAPDAAEHPTAGESIIGAATAAIVMFSKALSMETEGEGIRVHAIRPSLVGKTEADGRAMGDEHGAGRFGKAASRPGHGATEPANVADLILSLCSPVARRVTGQGVGSSEGISAG